uniref:Uncharacterized protein n=2 Tax=Noccaea caerulescens TaxID=107243 RepID=A0A1J3FFV9_NOCCA
MEAFEHMIVDEFNEEDFYETIEAPKFVDLTAPDHRPEGDDRYWFCSRVGCDQKHEEFIDSEAIYQKFVLRVMAARSPSVRLRKALYKKDFSVELKCPNTVPAKPSRSRVARLAMISSIPHKANNVGSKEAKVICINKNATPKAKVKGKESSKALTERKTKTKTQIQKQSPAAFRSVQNPTTSRVTPQNRLVAKALVFHSPNKLVKLKRSVELTSSVKKLRKLGTDSQRRSGLGIETCKRPRKGREVKSRVFDSVGPKKQQMDEKAKDCVTLKQRVKGKEEPLPSSVPLKSHEANGVELENQPSKSEALSDTVKQYENALALEEKNATISTDVKREAVSVIKESGGDDRAKQYETREIEDKENASPFNKENVDKESDDKENSSALDNNSNRCRKKKVFGKKETTQKAMTIAADKCFNGKTVSANKYTKPKLTNPKPFRLRTNERRILKEANTDKKPQCALAKEEGEESTNILRPVRLGKNTSSRSKAFRGTSTTTTLVRHDASENMVNGTRVALGTKKKVASKKIETVSSGRNGESKVAAIINKPYVCGVASVEKRPATIPKGPNFHTIHVPKSCTKRVASQV